MARNLIVATPKKKKKLSPVNGLGFWGQREKKKIRFKLLKIIDFINIGHQCIDIMTMMMMMCVWYYRFESNRMKWISLCDHTTHWIKIQLNFDKSARFFSWSIVAVYLFYIGSEFSECLKGIEKKRKIIIIIIKKTEFNSKQSWVLSWWWWFVA